MRATPFAGVALGIAAIAVAVLLAGRIGAGRAADELRDRALAALPLAAGTLTAEIEKQRLIPEVLAQDELVREALLSAGISRQEALNEKLQTIATDALASVIYVIGADGIAIAASNAGEPTSFVGSDYRFRHYFSDAMAKGAASQYALGTVSRKPGLYIARRIDVDGSPLGVAVLKVELDRVEANWQSSGFVVFVTDEHGVVLATSVPEWRFHALAPLSDEATVAAREQLQLVDAAFEALPLQREEGTDLLTLADEGRKRHFVEAGQYIPGVVPGWRIVLLSPADAALSSATDTFRLTTLLSLLLATALVTLLLRRRRAVRLRQEGLARMNAELENRVALRTIELTRSNQALAGEIAEREGAEAKVRRLRDDLAQANRLSILGQIAAGVAHEINQPVAAIRTFAENAGHYLGGGEPESTSANLLSIVGMTERIGGITDTLRSFARRASAAPAPLPVEDAIDGALSLLAGRIRDSGATIARQRSDPSPIVWQAASGSSRSSSTCCRTRSTRFRVDPIP